MTGSSIQQGTHGSSITINFNSKDVHTLISKLRDSAEKLELTPAARSELHTALSTVELQLRSAHPKTPIITECLRSVRNVLEGAVGSLLASGLIQEIGKILGS